MGDTRAKMACVKLAHNYDSVYVDSGYGFAIFYKPWKEGGCLMIYVMGVFGFIGGFALALKLVGYLLRDRSREELLEDKGLRVTYGLLTWGIAAFTSYCAILMFKFYFPTYS